MTARQPISGLAFLLGMAAILCVVGAIVFSPIVLASWYRSRPRELATMAEGGGVVASAASAALHRLAIRQLKGARSEAERKEAYHAAALDLKLNQGRNPARFAETEAALFAAGATLVDVPGPPVVNALEAPAEPAPGGGE